MIPKLLYVNPGTAAEDKKCTCSSKKQDSKFLLVPVSFPMEIVRFQWCGLHRKLNIVSKESWANPMPLSCPQQCFYNALLRVLHRSLPIHPFQSRIALKLTLSCMRDHQHHEE